MLPYIDAVKSEKLLFPNYTLSDLIVVGEILFSLDPYNVPEQWKHRVNVYCSCLAYAYVRSRLRSRG